jgi:hypothetical protein
VTTISESLAPSRRHATQLHVLTIVFNRFERKHDTDVDDVRVCGSCLCLLAANDVLLFRSLSICILLVLLVCLHANPPDAYCVCSSATVDCY